jgi:3-deoxy-D-manno-octulosonate 8-phosphate phosphatase (KDO 8-P phosphatase)
MSGSGRKMLLNKNIQKRAKKIKLIAMDVDGVLTGGEVIVLESGEEIKIWNVKDRFAFHYTRKGLPGIKYAWITGRKSSNVERCAKEIGIDYLYQNCMDKLDAVKEIILELGLKLEEVAYLGDDIVDIPVLKNVGLGVCPNDAASDVRKESDLVSEFTGGKGVFRHVAEIVLKSQNAWKKATCEYIS